ncbi:AAA family ATPase [Flagellimonas algicola]|uniref:Shikimate kinase n=1 Tax=Flagellimonas algicola TaxID=2583815 RepID=A0ABY2WJ64_9FLAO|nr:AAA family ATPase [Allomuricauda algicola]TMU54677.1 hypothetical protein FGG15_10760 [Allomuricauda algicola]
MIFLLIGQKGSGKSYIGELFETYFDIKFIRVEDWAKALKKSRNAMDGEYVSEVFQTIENGIKESMKRYPSVVFESTGLTPYFDRMLIRLHADFKVMTIGVKANSKTCMERIKTRDASIHIPIPLDQIESINKQVVRKNVQTTYTIENNNESEDTLKEKIAEILKGTGADQSDF